MTEYTKEQLLEMDVRRMKRRIAQLSYDCTEFIAGIKRLEQERDEARRIARRLYRESKNAWILCTPDREDV